MGETIESELEIGAGEESVHTKRQTTVRSWWGDEFTLEVLDRATGFESQFCRLFGFDLVREFEKLEVIVFSDYEKMTSYIKSRSKNARSNLGGVYLRNPSTIVVTSENGKPSEIEEILLHEMTHFLNHKYFIVMDPWLEEGLALLLTTRKKDMSPSEDHQVAVEAVKLAVKEEFSFDLANLIQIQGWQIFEAEENVDAYYFLSWVLTDYLYVSLGEDFPQKIRAFVQARLQNDFEKSRPLNAYKSAFGESPEETEEGMVEFYR